MLQCLELRTIPHLIKNGKNNVLVFGEWPSDDVNYTLGGDKQI